MKKGKKMLNIFPFGKVFFNKAERNPSIILFPTAAKRGPTT